MTYEDVLQTLASWRDRPVLVTAGGAPGDAYWAGFSGRLGERERREIPDLPLADVYQVSGNPSTQFTLSPEAFVSAKIQLEAAEPALLVRLQGFVLHIARYPRHLHDQPR